MKVFWWQGGLHAEPETPEEGRALRMIYDATKRWSIAGKGGNGPKVTGASLSRVSSEEVLEHLVGD